MNTLTWCQAFTELRTQLDKVFAQLGYHPFFSKTLQPSIGFDPSNDVLKVDGTSQYLRTSPEREMKIALQQFKTSLYEIGKVFRGGRDNATGPIHREEFWMCEFYKAQATLADLTQDIQVILKKTWQHFRTPDPFLFSTVTFDEIFERACQTPLTQWLSQRSPPQALDELDFLYADRIQPALAAQPGFIALSHFPYPLCGLAELSPETQNAPPAKQRYLRMELSYQGIELLNGYQELQQGRDLSERLKTTVAFQRHAQHNHGPLMDPVYEAIVEQGLPPSAGCALGLDRLLMILLKTDHIWTHTAINL